MKSSELVSPQERSNSASSNPNIKKTGGVLEQQQSQLSQKKYRKKFSLANRRDQKSPIHLHDQDDSIHYGINNIEQVKKVHMKLESNNNHNHNNNHYLPNHNDINNNNNNNNMLYANNNILPTTTKLFSHTDSEELEKDFLSLKKQRNLLFEENRKLRTKISYMEAERIKIQKLMSNQQQISLNPHNRLRELIKLRSEIWTEKILNNDLKESYEKIKRSIKHTKIKELECQNEILYQEMNSINIKMRELTNQNKLYLEKIRALEFKISLSNEMHKENTYLKGENKNLKEEVERLLRGAYVIPNNSLQERNDGMVDSGKILKDLKELKKMAMGKDLEEQNRTLHSNSNKKDRTLRYHTEKKLQEVSTNIVFPIGNNNNKHNNSTNNNKKQPAPSSIYKKHMRAESSFDWKNNLNRTSSHNFRVESLTQENQKYRSEIEILNRKLKEIQMSKFLSGIDLSTLDSIKKTAMLLNYRLRAQHIRFENLINMLIPENIVKDHKVSKKGLLMVLSRDPFNITNENQRLDFCNYLINDRNSQKNKKQETVEIVMRNFHQILGPYCYLESDEQRRLFHRIENNVKNNRSQMLSVFKRMSEKESRKLHQHIFLEILSRFGFTTDMLNLVMTQLAVTCEDLQSIRYEKFFNIFEFEGDIIGNDKNNSKNLKERMLQQQGDIVQELPEEDIQTIQASLNKKKKQKRNQKFQKKIEAVIQKHELEV